MRRFVMVGFGLVLVATMAACGDAPSPEAIGSPGLAASVDPGVSPSASAAADVAGSTAPVTAASAAGSGLTGTEKGICGRRVELTGKLASNRVLFLGVVSGWYEGDIERQKRVLGDLNVSLADVRALFAEAAAKGSTPRFVAAAKADLAAVDKILADVKAAGDDYKGKVVAALSTDALTTFQLSTLCGAES